VVTLHFRGLRLVKVPPYWLGDPGLCLPQLIETCRSTSGLPLDQPTAGPKPIGSSHGVTPTSGYNPTWPAEPANSFSSHKWDPRALTSSATLMEFASPSAHQLRRVYSTPACHTGYVPSTGFHTLSTAYSSPERPALFHAGNAHGVLLFRDFPSLSGPGGSSPRNYPPGVFPPHWIC
jgi:hypothetical protein